MKEATRSSKIHTSCDYEPLSKITVAVKRPPPNWRMQGLDDLPNELIRMIFRCAMDNQDIRGACSFRRVNKRFGATTKWDFVKENSEYFFRRIWVSLTTNNFEKLVELAKDEHVWKFVEEIYFETNYVGQKNDGTDWELERDFLPYYEGLYDDVDNDLRENRYNERAHREWHKYQVLKADQARLVRDNNALVMLSTALEKLTNVKTIKVLQSESAVEDRSNNKAEAGWINRNPLTLYLDRAKGMTYVMRLVTDALGASDIRLTEFETNGWDLDFERDLPESEDGTDLWSLELIQPRSFANLKILRLHGMSGIDYSPRDEWRDWAPQRQADCFADAVASAPLLERLEIYFSADCNHLLVGNTMAPRLNMRHLKTLVLGYMDFDEPLLRSMLNQHRATLEQLTLREIVLAGTTISHNWSGIFNDFEQYFQVLSFARWTDLIVEEGEVSRIVRWNATGSHNNHYMVDDRQDILNLLQSGYQLDEI